MIVEMSNLRHEDSIANLLSDNKITLFCYYVYMNRVQIHMTHIVGVDEVGRGPLAGPVMVGVFCVPVNYDQKHLKGVKDSKQLTEKKREEINTFLCEEKKRNNIRFETAFVTASKIDEWGMARSVQTAIARALKRLQLNPKTTHVLLDGLLKAPNKYIHQETIVKGDQKEVLIGAASIVAKVRRDELMKKYARMFPCYGFDIHKGYGTRLHSEAIKKNGLCTLHRKSFTKRFQ